MKRSYSLFFALVLFFLILGTNTSYGAATIQSAALSLQIDADGNGFINFGDTIRIRAVATYTGANWDVPPNTNLTQIGLSANYDLPRQGTTAIYQADILLNSWQANSPNYNPAAPTFFTINASEGGGADTLSTNQMLFDIVQVAGTNAQVSPALAGQGDTLTIEITDTNYQANPNGGTVATVDLTPIGGNAATTMTYVAPNRFSTTAVPPNNTNFTGALAITLRDPFHPAQQYLTNSLTIDTQPSDVDEPNTNVTIQSGNTTALPGDVLRLTARVNTFDSETVTVTSAPLTAAAANPAINVATNMNLTYSAGVGQPAEWQLDVVLTETVLKNSSLPITFTFTDDAGNNYIVTKNIAIDLDRPSFAAHTATVYYPNGTASALQYATASCQLEMSASFTINLPPDNLTVNADLSPIGGPANFILSQVSGTSLYRSRYTIPTGSIEDGTAHTFIITAKDAAGNLVYRGATPAISVDNSPPSINNLQLTKPNTNLLAGDIFTISLTATGIENGSVSVDLSSIGQSPVATITHISGTSYSETFTLEDSVTAGLVRDGNTAFTVSVNDTLNGNITGHIIQQNTQMVMVDNEPATALATGSNYTHTLYPADDIGFARIADNLSFHVETGSAPVRVLIDLSQLGLSASTSMIASASNPGWYDARVTGGVATGTLNKIATATFPITIEDGAGNQTQTSVSISIDTQPVYPTNLMITTSYKPGRNDSAPGTINLNKHLKIELPYTMTAADDQATATIDLSNFNGNAIATLTDLNGSYSLEIDIDTQATGLDANSYRFQAFISDDAGNRNSIYSSIYRVDTIAPTVVATATVALSSGSVPINIGDELIFEVEVANNESTAPTIDLSNIGGSANQAMGDNGNGKYKYIAIVAEGTGTLNGSVASWPIIVWDNDQKYVVSNTNVTASVVDSVPPQITAPLTVSGMPGDGNIRIGDTITFIIGMDMAEPAGTATIDLTAIGGPDDYQMHFNAATDTYSCQFTAIQTNQEYSNYVFTAKVKDPNGNMVESKAGSISSVDCQPPVISNQNIFIYQNNSDNPVANVANRDDILMVYASISAHLDATMEATIASGVTDFATATMQFNSVNNRHEAQFTVSPSGTNNWASLFGENLTFKVTGSDDLGNTATMTSGISAFTVRNEASPIATHAFTLSPNYLATEAAGLPVYNLGSDTVGDKLFANVRLDYNTAIHRAWIDFSELGTGTYDLQPSGEGATSAVGIPAANLPSIDNRLQRDIYLKVQDQAGNITVATQSFYIDNVAPTIQGATFDGQKLNISVSESIASYSISQWQLVGSDPALLGTPAFLSLLGCATDSKSLFSFEVTLSQDQMETIVQWASTPLYLKVSHGAAPLTDMADNWMPTVDFYPVTITDSTWREPVKITQLSMTQNWPTSIAIDIHFNKAVDAGTLAASSGILLFSDAGLDFSTPDYNEGYIFQASTTAQASDTFNWISPTQLQIDLCDTGKVWIARKISNNPTTKLKFATRSNQAFFVKDTLGKEMPHIPTSSPIDAIDNRPTDPFWFSGIPNEPKLDLENNLLTLTSTDQVLLNTKGFYTISDALPTMGIATPTQGNAISSYKNNISLHDVDSGNNSVLELKDLDLTLNDKNYNTTIKLELTNNDITNIYSLFQTSVSPDWNLKINADAFNNLWGSGNRSYLTTGNPGEVTIIAPTGLTAPSLAACSISDYPPTKSYSADNLSFEIEIFPPQKNGVNVPLRTAVDAEAKIIIASNSNLITDGNFVSWTKRTVNGKERFVARFTNTTALTANLQREVAQIVATFTDIFGNSYSVAANQAYDLNTKTDSTISGFSNPASATIIIDSQEPTLANIIPADVIGKFPAGTDFTVIFSENMDQSFTPTLSLATASSVMSFSFKNWTNSTTAAFTNNSDFVSSLPNGTWTYEISGGVDLAGNAQSGTLTKPVQVRTHAPDVLLGDVHLKTTQNIINQTFTDKPWNADTTVVPGSATFEVTYQNSPLQHLPHFLKLFDSNNNEVGSVQLPVALIGNQTNVAFNLANFSQNPPLGAPATYSVKVEDSSQNLTGTITEIYYDNEAPDVTSFAFTRNIASTSNNITYYRPTAGDFDLQIVTSTTRDNLRLARYSHETGATSTYSLLQNPAGTYSFSGGSTYNNGTYTLTIIDYAGNVAAGLSSRVIRVDKQQPVVTAIKPDTMIGNAPIGAFQFNVEFSEAMDADPSYEPTLTLATTGYTIPMAFQHWTDYNNATTAVFINDAVIDTTFPSGTYTYRLTGGRDLAFNSTVPTIDMAHTVEVLSQGPFANIITTTSQPHLYATTPPNMAFSDNYGGGIATLTIDYIAGPFNTDHSLLIYDSTDTEVASLALTAIDPAIIQITSANLTSGPGTYRFKLRDTTDTISGSYLPTDLVYDTASPSISYMAFVSDNGTATTDVSGGMRYHYNPNLGDSAISLTTSMPENMVLVIASNTIATQTAPMSSSNGTSHSVILPKNITNNGNYLLTSADTAGNMALTVAVASSAILHIDTVRPSVASATPIRSGSLQAGAGTFRIIFDEGMSTASAPTLVLASTSVAFDIPMTYQHWEDEYTCVFTNTNAIDNSIPNGTWTYEINGAHDYAGNENNSTGGAFTVVLFSKSPNVTAKLLTQQPLISPNIVATAPFSLNNSVASLSLVYNEGPYEEPHELRIYNASNTQIATRPITIVNKLATVTVNAAFFGTPAPSNFGPTTYSFKVADSIGNISTVNPTKVIYDNLEPTLAIATFTGVSTASSTPYYYNEQIHGNLNVSYQTNATDQLQLALLDGVATRTYLMNRNGTDHSVSLTPAQMLTVPEGNYGVTAFDMAGNPGGGAAALTALVIDRTLPAIATITVDNGPFVCSSPAGQATFTVEFSESMNIDWASTTLSLATSTKEIKCVLATWTSLTEAVFVSAEAITPDIPQGIYNYLVTAQDVTGNSITRSNAGSVSVRSRGPIVSSFKALSHQSTTAATATELLEDYPFSFNVAPGSSTLFIQLAKEPDSEPIHIHFQTGQTTVASYSLTLNGSNLASFTWSNGNPLTDGPIPTGPTTYNIRIADASGDFSLESYSWTMDASAPVVMEPLLTGGELATAAVYFNPSLHNYIGVNYTAVESASPYLRARTINSTDTYMMSSAGTNQWLYNFEGRDSHGAHPKPVLPDGLYTLDMVDKAGNIGLLASGPVAEGIIIIDTQAPIVSTYSLSIAGNPVTVFTPAAGNLTIQASTTENLDELGVYWITVLNSSNVPVRKLQLVNNAGNFEASWDGKDKNGNTVLDGQYKLIATDYTGNKASTSISVQAITSAFKITGIEQVSSNSLKIWLNQNVNAASLGGTNISAPGLTVSNIALAEPQAITMDVTPAFTHKESYTFTIATGTVLSIYGAGITGPGNVGILIADGEGPKVTGISFEELTGQQEFKVLFDEKFIPATAGDIANYAITGPNGAVTVAAATIQPDQQSVLITAGENLIEKQSYTITVTGVQDKYGNTTPVSNNSYTFEGQDLTPPVLEVGAFSNPANERDIIVVVTSNEELTSAPILQVAQSNAPVVTTVMQQGAVSTSFMLGVHLQTSYPGNGTLIATANDLAGNKGTGNTTFAVAYLSANKAASILSPSRWMKVDFNKQTLKDNAVIKIMQHKLEQDPDNSSSIKANLQLHASRKLRAANIGEPAIDQSELTPISLGYEIGLTESKLANSFKVNLKPSIATSQVGIGLFYQNGENWEFVSKNKGKDGAYNGQTQKSGIYALLRDTKAPRISLSKQLDLTEPFKTARPEFPGNIKEYGAGIDPTTLAAYVDKGPAQTIQVDAQGNFVFKPLADLTGGNHELELKAADNTGNVGTLASIKFQVVVPLQIAHIMQYPNPARRKAFIRISANRSDITEDLIKVRIYDSAGHKVRTLYGIKAVREAWGINARFLYDIPWDLRNERNRKVANGVYFAKVTIKDPDNPKRKIKKIHKLAVLR